MVDASTSDISSDVLSETKNTSQFVGFQLEGQHYAFRIEQIQEIVILDQITPTPQVAEYVEGVTNLRGAIIPIINLRKLLGMDPKELDSETRTIVVNVGDRTMGCMVDSVSQVIRIAEGSIQPAPDTLTSDGRHDIAGFAKLEQQLVVILDVNELLSPERLHRDRCDSGRLVSNSSASTTSSPPPS